MCHLGELCGPSVTREHAMSSVPGNLFHHTALIVCILSCYKALLSRLGSSAGPQHGSNIKGGKGPRDIMVLGALGVTRPLLSCIFRMPTRGRPRPPESGRGRGLKASRWRCCLSHKQGAVPAVREGSVPVAGRWRPCGRRAIPKEMSPRPHQTRLPRPRSTARP